MELPFGPKTHAARPMPSRPVTLTIIAFWLLTTAWFVAADIVPTRHTGDPPPYTIELADEATHQAAYIDGAASSTATKSAFS